MKRKVVRMENKASEMRAAYDFDYTKAVRGKYYRRILKEGANVVVLEPDIAQAFPTSNAVNDALRLVLEAGRCAERLPPRLTRVRSSRAKPIRAVS